MAVQQRRGSKTRKAKRRTHYKLVKPTNCGEYKLAHKMCSCGEYNGKQIVEK
jgi:large subunit ribosomal protein L32